MMNFVNRTQELKILNNSISLGIRVNIVYSLKGRGKSYLISHFFEENNNNIYYINVSSEELLRESHAEDYYFLKQIAEQLCNKLPFHSTEIIKTKLYGSSTNISFSVNALFAGIGFSVPKCYRLLQSSIIKNTKKVDSNIYIHIENMQKIDIPSLKFLTRLVNETNNVFLYLEYTIDDDKSIVVDSSSIYKKFNITPEYLEVKSLDWSHICSIFSSLHLEINESLQREYLQLDGDIKTLLFDCKHTEEVELNQDECFFLSFIELTTAQLDDREIYEIIYTYKQVSLIYNLRKLHSIISILIDKDVVSEINGNLFITREGLKHTDERYKLLATEILATYYIPIIESDIMPLTKDACKGIKILVSIFAKNNDIRLKKIVPFIKKNIIPLNYNKGIVDNLFESIKDLSDNRELFFCLIDLYISLGCYKEVLSKLNNNPINCYEYNIRYSTVLIHVNPEKANTETMLKTFIEMESNNDYKSAFYTCLVALYMKIKPSKFVLEFLKDIYDRQLVTTQDQKIINKNISIYYDFAKATEIIADSITFFRQNNMQKFETASLITLATRYFQNGNLTEAKSILEELNDKIYLSEEDLIYIDNNLANIDIYSETICDKTYDKLMTAYISMDDEYTKMLAANNLLIYFTYLKDYSSAKKYIDEIEKVGFEKYLFDEYLHLTYTNLIFYYRLIEDDAKVNKYINELQQLKENCQSTELKKYIDNTVSNQCLEPTDKWFFMSKYKFRAAFMGHWMINYYDI